MLSNLVIIFYSADQRVRCLLFSMAYLAISTGFCALLLLTTVLAGEEICQSYAGGHVYPQETRRTTGHTIQWSQAVSKFAQLVEELGLLAFNFIIIYNTCSWSKVAPVVMQDHDGWLLPCLLETNFIAVKLLSFEDLFLNKFVPLFILKY